MITLDARVAALPSSDLLAALERTAARGREVTADLIALLAECDARRLYAAEGYGSLFEFCVARLRLSEAQAYHRIQAARAARRFPLVLERLREGRVSLTAVALLREHLTEANHHQVLDWADGRRRREVEAFIRGLDPKPDVPFSVRRLPEARPATWEAARADDRAPGRVAEVAGSAHHTAMPTTESPLPLGLETVPAAPALATGAAREVTDVAHLGVPPLVAAAAPRVAAAAPRAEVRALAPSRYSLHVTISEETHDKLRRAQDLLRHAQADIGPALVIDRALTLLIAQLERRKAGAPSRGRHAIGKRSAARASWDPRAAMSPTTPESAATGEGGDKHADHPLRRPTVQGAMGESATAVTAAPRARPAVSARRRQRSRYIPSAVRRAVWDREGGRCGYVSASGIRCGATGRLEYHHRVPFADGGESTVANLVLACRTHNALEARRWFDSDQAESASPTGPARETNEVFEWGSRGTAAPTDGR